MLIKTEGLCKTYGTGTGTVRAVNNVSVEIPQRSLTVLRGKSGSGKTTLINMMGALDNPSSGRIWFNGRETTALTEAEKVALRSSDIGFVFQSVALIGNMTASENIDFSLRIAGMHKRERERRAAECLDMVGLSGRTKHIPQELSGGEQQRVAIARAVAHHPSVVFADEPTAQLDTQMGLQIMRLFLELINKERITVVMTTHDPEIIDIADRVYTLKDGELSDEL